jgi:hypothetical protein
MTAALRSIVRRASLVTIALTLMANCGLANDDVKKAQLVARFMAFLPIEEAAETYMAEYAKAMIASWQVTLADPDDATVEALKQELTRRLVRDYVSLKPVIAKLYRDQYTAEELSAVVDFYDSSLGRSIHAKEKAINEQLAKIIYPESLKRAEKHWLDSVELLRKQGKKL